MNLEQLNEEIARSERVLEELRQKREQVLEEEKNINAAATIIVESGIDKKYFKIAIRRTETPSDSSDEQSEHSEQADSLDEDVLPHAHRKKRVILREHPDLTYTKNQYRRMKPVKNEFLKEIPKSVVTYFRDHPLVDVHEEYHRMRVLPEKSPTTNPVIPTCISCNQVCRKYGNTTCPYRLFCGPCADTTVYTGDRMEKIIEKMAE